MNKHELQDLGGGTVSGLLASRAAWAPDNLALMFEDQRFTFGDLDRQATATGAGLMALDLARGDAVAIFMTNRPEHLFASHGVSRAGVVQVSVNTAYKGSFLQFTLQHSDAKVLITEARLIDALLSLGELPPALHTIVFVDGVPPAIRSEANSELRLLSWDDMLAGGDDEQEFPQLQPQETCAISFTSGTTGGSKGVVSPHLQGVVMGREAAV
ncbi:MAG: AMP-binding protein, partial [Frankiaceae bacterium]|nr:AMP-binding protein [Arenimonas sp.]